MSLESVVAGIKFWNSTVTWAPTSDPDYGKSGVEFDIFQKIEIINSITWLYENSPRAAALLEKGTTGGLEIKIYQTLSNSEGRSAPNAGIAGFNLDAISKFHYFNNSGVLVKEILDITVIHELFHAIDGSIDLTPNVPTEAEMNSPSFDYD